MKLMFKAHNVFTFLYLLLLTFLCISCSVFMLGHNEKCLTSTIQQHTHFMESYFTSFEDELSSINLSINDLGPVFHTLETTESEINEMLTDPFHTKSFLRTKFLYTCEPDIMSTYCENQFADNGWIVARKLLLSEYANAGGDWVRVYKKDGGLIRVHLYGYNVKSMPASHKDGQTVRDAVFDLINVSETHLAELLDVPFVQEATFQEKNHE